MFPSLLFSLEPLVEAIQRACDSINVPALLFSAAPYGVLRPQPVRALFLSSEILGVYHHLTVAWNGVPPSVKPFSSWG